MHINELRMQLCQYVCHTNNNIVFGTFVLVTMATCSSKFREELCY